MIVPMKEVTVLVAEDDVDSALEDLRRLGVLHVKFLPDKEASRAEKIRDRIKGVDAAISLTKRNLSGQQTVKSPQEKIPLCIEEINDLAKKKESLLARRQKIEQFIFWYQEWGVFSLAAMNNLRGNNVYVKLYLANQGDLKTVASRRDVFIVGRRKNKAYLAAVLFSPEEKLPFIEIDDLPKEEYAKLEEEYADLNKEVKEINGKLGRLGLYRKEYERYREFLEKEAEFYKVKGSMVGQEGFEYLQGFCPYDAVEKIKKAASLKKWGLLIKDPDSLADVPVLLRNHLAVRIIHPLFKFIGTLPGYNEPDVSLWVLIFFTLFFAMLIGDAGYGMIFFLLTFVARRVMVKKKTPPPQDLFRLFYLLGGATVVWGLLSGTWFGFEKIADLALFKLFVIDSLNSFIKENQSFLIYFCFLLGAVHLTLAHVILSLRLKSIGKTQPALAQAGWVCIVWAMFFIINNLVLNKPLPPFLLSLAATGTAIVLLFSHHSGNLVKAIFISLANMPLKLIGFFADILSYLRLFAVGYASVMVAVSFNDLAGESFAIAAGKNGLISIFGVVGGVAIIIFGHILNITLGMLSVLVHGLRLNLLEFASHLNMEWKGKEYRPFKE
ncbi:MAG: hypothetical protein ABH858_00300 [Candidatus Omnitrophota bacterium]